MIDQVKLKQQISHMKIISTTVGPNGDCWESSRYKDKQGYSVINVGKDQLKTHRYSFMIHNPDIDITNKDIQHTCGNNSCVNPDHLFYKLISNQSTSNIERLRIISTTAGPNGDCWESSLCRDKSGYVQMSINQKQVKGHRYSFMIHNPNIDIIGKLICHHCDHPPCINPKHLFLGNVKDNSIDMVNKDRSLKGSKHHKAILDEEIVKEILDGILYGKIKTVTKIAIQYNLNDSTVRNITREIGWKHVTKDYNMNLIRKIIHNNNPYEPKLDEYNVKDIKIRLSNKESCSSIGRLYNVSYQTISCIKNGKYYKDI